MRKDWKTLTYRANPDAKMAVREAGRGLDLNFSQAGALAIIAHLPPNPPPPQTPRTKGAESGDRFLVPQTLKQAIKLASLREGVTISEFCYRAIRRAADTPEMFGPWLEFAKVAYPEVFSGAGNSSSQESGNPR